MFYGYGFVCKRCCCSSPEPKQPDAPVVAQPSDVPSGSANAERFERSVESTPKPPPSSPIIAPVAQPNYPDLPTLNPSLIRQEDGTFIA